MQGLPTITLFYQDSVEVCCSLQPPGITKKLPQCYSFSSGQRYITGCHQDTDDILSHGNRWSHPFDVNIKKVQTKHQALQHPTKQGLWVGSLDSYQYQLRSPSEEGDEPSSDTLNFLSQTKDTMVNGIKSCQEVKTCRNGCITSIQLNPRWVHSLCKVNEITKYANYNSVWQVLA